MGGAKKGKPMYKLYGSPGAASFVVHWLLLELGQPVDVKMLDFERREQKSPEFLKLNPSGHVPVLVAGDTVLCEAAAIALWLADRHPEGGLGAPSDAKLRGFYYQWMFYLANTLQPAFRNWFYPAEAIDPPNSEAIQANARARIEAAFSRLNEQLTHWPYLAGPQPTVVDFHATMLMRWSRNMPMPATHWPALQAFVSRMKALPSFQRLNEREGLTEWL